MFMVWKNILEGLKTSERWLLGIKNRCVDQCFLNLTYNTYVYVLHFQVLEEYMKYIGNAILIRKKFKIAWNFYVSY